MFVPCTFVIRHKMLASKIYPAIALTIHLWRRVSAVEMNVALVELVNELTMRSCWGYPPFICDSFGTGYWFFGPSRIPRGGVIRVAQKLLLRDVARNSLMAMSIIGTEGNEWVKVQDARCYTPFAMNFSIFELLDVWNWGSVLYLSLFPSSVAMSWCVCNVGHICDDWQWSDLTGFIIT